MVPLYGTAWEGLAAPMGGARLRGAALAQGTQEPLPQWCWGLADSHVCLLAAQGWLWGSWFEGAID